ncbi:hypothetical protein [Neoaquamicrobium sediminum]|uniref:hypothetical protein n=1 Tax=Neoaquamicrobium sediminum TaxID=1849104 RepID=UPI0015633EFE|nr:hypothetical protein [Mesorhizobium sediminum]NRC55170.1 hypothetical protein [Mesorhizobium sediminum]
MTAKSLERRLAKLEAAREGAKRRIRAIVDKNTGILRPGPDGIMCHVVTIKFVEEWTS